MPLSDAQKLLNARLSYGGAEISMKVINGRHLQEVVTCRRGGNARAQNF